MGKTIIRNDEYLFILSNPKNVPTAMTLSFLHQIRQRRNVIIIGGIILAIGFIGMMTTGSVVIQDTAKNNLDPHGYPNTKILGISVYSFEYASLFLTLFGVFLFTGGLVAMDSQKKQKQKKKI